MAGTHAIALVAEVPERPNMALLRMPQKRDRDNATVRELERLAGDYCTPIRIGDGVSLDAERRLYDELVRLQAQLDGETAIDRELATLLAELVVAANGSVLEYSGPHRLEVARSVATIGEAVTAVLTPDEMPPLPRRP
jgi:hypothetical protein